MSYEGRIFLYRIETRLMFAWVQALLEGDKVEAFGCERGAKLCRELRDGTAKRQLMGEFVVRDV